MQGVKKCGLICTPHKNYEAIKQNIPKKHYTSVIKKKNENYSITIEAGSLNIFFAFLKILRLRNKYNQKVYF